MTDFEPELLRLLREILRKLERIEEELRILRRVI
jgi:hypothetical protein